MNDGLRVKMCVHLRAMSLEKLKYLLLMGTKETIGVPPFRGMYMVDAAGSALMQLFLVQRLHCCDGYGVFWNNPLL